MLGKLKKTVRILFNKLSNRYKLSISEYDDFLPKVTFSGSFWTLLSILFIFFLLMFTLFFILLRTTPLKEYIHWDGFGQYRKEILEAYERIDSLEQLSRANDLYLSNLQNIMRGTAGESIDEAIKRDEKQIIQQEKKSSLSKSSKDQKYLEDEAVLKSLLELKTPILTLENTKSEGINRGVADYSFYSPVKGMITSGYDQKSRHFATDIATKMNEPIQSVLDGHVIFSSFTPSTGYVTIIQHRDNLLSVYKHCEALLKKEGVFVRGGEVIALAGDTGELSTGPHLHFELWYNGNAVDAEDYINF